MSRSFRTAARGLVAVAFATAFAVQASACNVQQEQQKIIATTKHWLSLIARKDSNGIAGLYTADGMFFLPHVPRATGREQIAKVWASLFKVPGMALNIRPTRIDISKGCDVAIDIGIYAFAYNTKQGRVVDRGKYVVVWKNVGGRWMAFTDILNTDLRAQ